MVQYKIHEQGDGLPLVMLHGMMGAPENWLGVFPHLPPTCRSIALRFPFFDNGQILNSVESITEYTERFLEDADLRACVLCGNSLGGHVGLNLAVERPELVKGLVLTGSSGLFEKSFSVVGKKPDRQWFHDKMSEVFCDPVHVTDEMVDEVMGTLRIRRNIRTLVQMAKSAKRDNVSERLKQIACPTLLIWGREDRVTPPPVAEEFHTLIPNSELVWVDRCGHAAMMEHPRQFGEIVARWWARKIEPDSPPAAGATC